MFRLWDVGSTFHQNPQNSTSSPNNNVFAKHITSFRIMQLSCHRLLVYIYIYIYTYMTQEYWLLVYEQVKPNGSHCATLYKVPLPNTSEPCSNYLPEYMPAETTTTWHVNYTTSCPTFVTKNVHKVKRHGENNTWLPLD